MNHEFKNIVTILDYPIRSLNKKLGENEVDHSTLATIEKIQTNFGRFADLIHAFGALGRPSNLRMERIPVTEAIKDVIYFAEYLAKEKGIRFSVEYKAANEALFFFGNQILLTQTLLNLVKNSCDAVDQLSALGKWVRLEISEENRMIYFRVVDGGKGIPEMVKKKLFHERVTTKGASGTGLGLGISRKFTMIQGGRLEYSDDQENTTFTVTLKAG